MTRKAYGCKSLLYYPEVWGGIECTINRVNDRFLDQFDLTRFYDHPQWIDEIIQLGIKTIRFPVLWEKHQSVLNKEIDWSFTADQLTKLKKNKIAPIVGLLHHGSGPLFTNLLDPAFSTLFAAYAATVAARFPWVKYYTPVNEPLTTARFAGLYGHWYPHKKNDVSFIKMLLNQLKGTVLAMQEIRKINPEAQLVQTEDLGKTYSTSLLSYQAAFENHRRWLTYDILCGRFTIAHPLWNYFMRLGIEEESLRFFIDNPCIPAIIGVNHYLTSERYIDDEIENYPSCTVGGNSLHHYVDVEAVRVHLNEPHGIKILLTETWERYQLPIAITEVHLHCTREEQLRWIKEVYDTVMKLRNNAVDIIAITAWSLLGSFGWSKLLTCNKEDCEYETGAFDISSGYARPTAVASFIKNLVNNKAYNNDIVKQPGWWKLDSRYFVKQRVNENYPLHISPQPVIITGKTGTLGKAFFRLCGQRNLHACLLGRQDVDITDLEELENMIRRYRPWAIINTAGYVKVDEAESNKEKCFRENCSGPEKLAILCEQYNVKLVIFSSDLVFDGNKTAPYNEDDEPAAINVYGQSKQMAETFCANINPSSLIIRTSAFFGPWDKNNFAFHLLTDLDAGKTVHIPADIFISPTYVPHLVHATLDLLIDNECGIWHLSNKAMITWYQFALLLAEKTGKDAALISPSYETVTAAPRPRNSSLTSRKYNQMPSLNAGIEHFFQHNKVFTPTLVDKL